MEFNMLGVYGEHPSHMDKNDWNLESQHHIFCHIQETVVYGEIQHLTQSHWQFPNMPPSS